MQVIALQLFEIDVFAFDTDSDWIAHSINTFQFSLGIFLAAIRLIEPYVLKNFKKDLSFKKTETKSRRIDSNRKQFSKESLCSFINSAVNIEFVYLILVGINKFMDNYNSENFLNYTKREDKLKISKNKELTKVTMMNVEFKDQHLWNVDQSSRADSKNSDQRDRLLSLLSSVNSSSGNLDPPRVFSTTTQEDRHVSL